MTDALKCIGDTAILLACFYGFVTITLALGKNDADVFSYLINAWFFMLLYRVVR